MLLIETDEGRVLISARICIENKEGVAVNVERTSIASSAKSGI